VSLPSPNGLSSFHESELRTNPRADLNRARRTDALGPCAETVGLLRYVIDEGKPWAFVVEADAYDGGGCEQNEHVTSLHHNPTCVAEEENLPPMRDCGL
jgi:hypothetical protein